MKNQEKRKISAELLLCVCQKSGWVFKRGEIVKSWKRRFMILNENYLYYFKHENDYEPVGIIKLSGASVTAVGDMAAAVATSSEVKPPANTHLFQIFAENRTYWLCTDYGQTQMESWVRRLREGAKWKAVSSLVTESLKIGFLDKIGGRRRTLKRRLFVLRRGMLYYHKSEETAADGNSPGSSGSNSPGTGGLKTSASFFGTPLARSTTLSPRGSPNHTRSGSGDGGVQMRKRALSGDKFGSFLGAPSDQMSKAGVLVSPRAVRPNAEALPESNPLPVYNDAVSDAPKGVISLFCANCNFTYESNGCPSSKFLFEVHNSVRTYELYAFNLSDYDHWVFLTTREILDTNARIIRKPLQVGPAVSQAAISAVLAAQTRLDLSYPSPGTPQSPAGSPRSTPAQSFIGPSIPLSTATGTPRRVVEVAQSASHQLHHSRYSSVESSTGLGTENDADLASSSSSLSIPDMSPRRLVNVIATAIHEEHDRRYVLLYGVDKGKKNNKKPNVGALMSDLGEDTGSSQAQVLLPGRSKKDHARPRAEIIPIRIILKPGVYEETNLQFNCPVDIVGSGEKPEDTVIMFNYIDNAHPKPVINVNSLNCRIVNCKLVLKVRKDVALYSQAQELSPTITASSSPSAKTAFEADSTVYVYKGGSLILEYCIIENHVNTPCVTVCGKGSYCFLSNCSVVNNGNAYGLQVESGASAVMFGGYVHSHNLVRTDYIACMRLYQTKLADQTKKQEEAAPSGTSQ